MRLAERLMHVWSRRSDGDDDELAKERHAQEVARRGLEVPCEVLPTVPPRTQRCNGSEFRCGQ